MSQVKQVHQLWMDGVKIKEIARRTQISRKTVKKYLRLLKVRADGAELPQESEITDKQLATAVYRDTSVKVVDERHESLFAHFKKVEAELSKTGVTKKILWEEYKEKYPEGFKYSQYCNLFRQYIKNNDAVFHCDYRKGEFIQADFAGKKLSYVDRVTGELVQCEVFVSILPFSGLIFCMAVLSQKIPDFATCIVSMLKYFGGVSLTILVDNFRTAVKKSDKYEPCFTDMCYQLSDHYNTTFSATRPYSPRDKAMVEQAVNIVYHQVYAPLRNEVFYSLESLNYHVRSKLDQLNLKPYKDTSESRREIFDRDEKSSLKPLPEVPYELLRIRKVTVYPDYSIRLPDNKHYYTVPYRYVGKKLVAYYNSHIVEIYHHQDRVATHIRKTDEPKFNRIAEHMPENHKAVVTMRGWTVEHFTSRASQVGAYTVQVVTKMANSSIFPEQHFKACNALLHLQDVYGRDRLEAACKRGSIVPRPTLELIRNILKSGQDKQPLLFEDAEGEKPSPAHENIRGKDYYK